MRNYILRLRADHARYGLCGVFPELLALGSLLAAALVGVSYLLK